MCVKKREELKALLKQDEKNLTDKGWETIDELKHDLSFNEDDMKRFLEKDV